MSRLRWLAPRLALALGSLVLFFGGAELATVAWVTAAYGVPRIDGQPQGLYANAPGEAPRLQPGARLSGLRYQIAVNQHGFRGAELSEAGPHESVRIWCVGGSTTFDIYAPSDAQAWPAVAERLLRETFPGKTIDVINAGIPGEILEGSTRTLRSQGRALGVDYVVVHHGPNDLRLAYRRPVQGATGPGLWEHTTLYNTLSEWLQGQGLTPPDPTLRRFDGAEAQALRRSLVQLLHVIRELGAEPIFATHAARISEDSTGAALRREVGELGFQWSMSPESVRDVLAGYNALIAELAAQQGAPLADFRAAVPADRRYWGDATHFSAEGSALAGAELARVMEPVIRGR